MTIARLQQRRGTTTEWEAPTANPILAAGEIGVDLTTGQFRIGNGTSRWTSLVPFYPGVSSGSSGGGSGAAPALVVAAPNSPPAVKARADVVCTTGTDHAATINAAIVAANNQILSAGATKYGAVVLADGNYTLNTPILIPSRGFSLRGQGMNTILMKGSTFTDGGQGTGSALIKMAATTAAQASCAILIADLYLVGTYVSSNGAGSASGSAIGGIRLEVTAATNTRGTYGYPIAAADADNMSVIRNVMIENVSTGLYIGGSYNRHNYIEGVTVHTVSAGGQGIYLNASDNEVIRCTVAGGRLANSTGFNVSGGNSILTHCKAFYFDEASCIGYDVASSRVSLTACEAQDNTIGFKVTGTGAQLVACRVDTQVDSDVAFDLVSADEGSFQGLIVAARGAGTLTRGIALPGDQGTTAGYSLVDAYIDPTNVTTAVTKGAGFTAVTSDATMPTGVEARIVILGVGTYRGEF